MKFRDEFSDLFASHVRRGLAGVGFFAVVLLVAPNTARAQDDDMRMKQAAAASMMPELAPKLFALYGAPQSWEEFQDWFKPAKLKRACAKAASCSFSYPGLDMLNCKRLGAYVHGVLTTDIFVGKFSDMPMFTVDCGGYTFRRNTDKTASLIDNASKKTVWFQG